MPDRPYTFLDLTNSLCATCLRKVEAKVVEQDGRIYLHKWCPEHRFQKVLISTDPDYYKLCRATNKPGQMPRKFQTPIRLGCPYDCGLCTDHEQHGCLTLVEITDGCNLTCPVCYAESSPQRMRHRTLEQVDFMLDCVVRNEGEPDVVQISGGEPTIHPQFFEILDLAKRKPIKHLMVNSNGLRIASDAEFTKRLASYMPRFEIYLQFDSLHPSRLRALRGEDLSSVRRKAIDRLNEHNLSTTLVVTLKKGLNDDEIGEILDFALQQHCVRGVTFQPVQDAGRNQDFDPATDRLTLGEVRQRIVEQSSVFAAQDIVPVPCHPDCIAMAYALKMNGKVTALTSQIDPAVFLSSEGSTIMYERNDVVREVAFKLFANCCGGGAEEAEGKGEGAFGRVMGRPTVSSRSSCDEHGRAAHVTEIHPHPDPLPEYQERGSPAPPARRPTSLRQLLCCLPQVSVPPNVTYENVFRLIVMQFLDPHNFDVRSVKRACVQIVHPDGRVIPFDTYNLFYREGKSLPPSAAGTLTPLSIAGERPAENVAG